MRFLVWIWKDPWRYNTVSSNCSKYLDIMLLKRHCRNATISWCSKNDRWENVFSPLRVKTWTAKRGHDQIKLSTSRYDQDLGGITKRGHRAAKTPAKCHAHTRKLDIITRRTTLQWRPLLTFGTVGGRKGFSFCNQPFRFFFIVHSSYVPHEYMPRNHAPSQTGELEIKARAYLCE